MACLLSQDGREQKFASSCGERNQGVTMFSCSLALLIFGLIFAHPYLY